MIADSTFDQSSIRDGVLATRVVTLAQPDGKELPAHNVASLLNAVRRGWKIALPLGVGLASLAALLAWKVSEPKYSASAFLRIAADDRPLVFKTADVSAGRGSDFRLYKSTQQQLLLTPFVLNAALRDPEVSALEEIRNRADAIGWLQKQLVTKFPADGEIMQVSFETTTPSACVKIVNGVVDAFMQEVVVDERNERLNRLSSLERVYGEAEGKVRNKQSELKSLATALGTSDSDSLTVAQQSALQQFGHMQEKLSVVQFELMQAEGELKIAQQLELRQNESAEANAGNAAVPDDQLAERSPELLRLEEEVETLAARLTSLGTKFGGQHPAVQQLKQDLTVKQQLLQKRRRDAVRHAKAIGEKQHILTTAAGTTYDLFALSTRAEILRNQEKIVKEKVDALSEETRQLGRSSIDIELMRSEIASLEDVLRRVGEEIERTSIELKTSSRIKLLSSAAAASPPNATKRISRALAAGVLGLFAPLGLLAVWDLSRKRVNNVEGVTRSLSVPSLGVLPVVAKGLLERGRDNPRSGSDRRRAELDEAVDGMTSMMLHCAQAERRQVYMICSAMPGEGKSTVACQLAERLASSGKKVALVDFDLRRPRIHQYLELPLEPGLAETLGGKLLFREALQSGHMENLAVLTAGRWTGNLQERYTSGALDQLFENLRLAYDMVIVDACPILPVHDARIIGKFADGVILTLMRDKTRLPLVAKACEILKAYGIAVLGTVIIGAAPTGYSHYYRADASQSGPLRLLTAGTRR